MLNFLPSVCFLSFLRTLWCHTAMAQHHPCTSDTGGGAPLPQTPPRPRRVFHRLRRCGCSAQLFDAECGVLHQWGVSTQGHPALPGPDGGQGVWASRHQAVPQRQGSGLWGQQLQPVPFSGIQSGVWIFHEGAQQCDRKHASKGAGDKEEEELQVVGSNYYVHILIVALKLMVSLWYSTYRMKDQRTFSNPLAVGPSDSRVERLLTTINLQPYISQASSAPATAALLSKAGENSDPSIVDCTDVIEYFVFCSLTLFTSLVVDQVWKQQTLLQLLQIVELPVLDCILSSPAQVQQPGWRVSLSRDQDLVISNTCLDRELPNTLNLPQ